MINQIIVTKSIANKLLIMTSGEDQCISIWDTNFHLISKFVIAEEVTKGLNGNQS